MNTILKLYMCFFKIGVFGYGGGYAMLPLIQREVVTKNAWLTTTEFLDIIGISQMTPGPISINTATFVGYKISGFWGSVFATLGVVSFSFILVSIATHYILKFKDSNVLKSALTGMRPALIGLIFSAFLSLSKQSYIDIKSIIIGGFILLMSLKTKIHPILTIVIAGGMGTLFYGIM
ncbi:chromate transporter [Tissierella sp. MSJ-40]|uniref:Chromate transporter n=1 Tax=Tissierella simiarum TaxID=2841534 RepID=A0ABS6E131_9FIRM|nr:chromate transporter [Tissierella simiarum]MBU5436497.1 chromate transporter [Tissierella simiarum]